MNKNILLKISFLLLAIIPLHAFSYSWLYVSDPQDWGTNGQGSIDEAVLTIEPKGVYWEYGLYLTFSANGHDFTINDTVEINYNFTLPQNSIVHDSWLWVEDEIVEAELLDRWKAFQIYEGIVQRRRDPSVLYKSWGNNYRLQVFPMRGDGSRKVKITYLAPTNWTGTKVTAPLPTDMLLSSFILPKTMTVYVKETDRWSDPEIVGYNEIVFNYAKIDGFGKCKKADIPSDYFNNNLNLGFSSPLENGIFLQAYKTGEEGYYEMVFVPSKAFELTDTRKVAVLFDFEEENSANVNGNLVFQNLKSILLNNLNEHDYFNLFLTRKEIPYVSTKWIKASPENINLLFENLGRNPIPDKTDLQTLLFSAIDFINVKGGEGEVLLLSNSNDYSATEKANEFMDALKAVDHLPPIHIIDFYDRWSDWFCWENYCYAGNEYLYTMITRYTSGNNFKFQYWDQNVSDILTKAFTSIGDYITAFDLHTSLLDGFCHSRYTIQSGDMSWNINSPIVQVGKFNGDVPFEIEATAIHKGEMFSLNKSLSAGQIHIADSLLEEVWTGNYIEALSNTWNYDNKIVNKIVEASLSERVLSNYTAFLALEPGMVVDPDPANPNPPSGGSLENTMADASFGDNAYTAIPTSVDDREMEDKDKVKVRALPNPFTNQVIVQVSMPESIDWRTLHVEIVDLNGRVLKIFDPQEYMYDGVLNIFWDGTVDEGNEVASGIYVLRVSGNGVQRNLKLFKAN